MTKIDLSNSIPDVLAETATLPDLLETVRDINQWDDRQAEVLDFIYRARLVRMIRSKADPDQFIELIGHLDQVTHPSRVSKLNQLQKAYGDRWMAYMDVLDTRLAALQSDVPSRLLERKNVKEILKLVLDKGAVQRKDIEVTFKLRQANLTRVLKMMAAAELIECRTRGREKLVLPGPNAETFREVKPGVSRPKGDSRRGSFYLSSDQNSQAAR